MNCMGPWCVWLDEDDERFVAIGRHLKNSLLERRVETILGRLLQGVRLSRRLTSPVETAAGNPVRQPSNPCPTY
jgi:hypothetical protein